MTGSGVQYAEMRKRQLSVERVRRRSIVWSSRLVLSYAGLR